MIKWYTELHVQTWMWTKIRLYCTRTVTTAAVRGLDAARTRDPMRMNIHWKRLSADGQLTNWSAWCNDWLEHLTFLADSVRWQLLKDVTCELQPTKIYHVCIICCSNVRKLATKISHTDLLMFTSYMRCKWLMLPSGYRNIDVGK
jgi:hypothetical protein